MEFLVIFFTKILESLILDKNPRAMQYKKPWRTDMPGPHFLDRTRRRRYCADYCPEPPNSHLPVEGKAMGALLERLKEKKLLLSDGAWGTMLQERGLAVGECPELWNLAHPDKVRGVAAAYVAADSDMILANTFGGSRYKLKKFGLADQTAAINRAGAKLSLEAAGDKAVVAVSVGATGEFLEPYGDTTEEEMEEIFYEQIKAIAEAGAGAVCIETMTAIEEAVLAVKAAKRVDSGLDVICTMTFDPTPNGFRTMMGVDCGRAAEELAAAGADIIGANCGNGMEKMIQLLDEFQSVTKLPLAVHANAGVPELVNGKTVFRESPESMAAGVEELVKRGAVIIGGCCGTTPVHIAAMGREVRRLREQR